MLLKVAVENIENSEVFKSFKEKNPEFYLAHAFTTIDNIQGNWLVGYYSKSKDKAVVFEADKEIKRHPEEDIFKEPDKKVEELDLKKVKISLEKALAKAENLKIEKYSAETVKKIIVILQKLETELYNLTLVTETFNMINVKIDANTGDVISESITSILGLKKD